MKDNKIHKYWLYSKLSAFLLTPVLMLNGCWFNPVESPTGFPILIAAIVIGSIVIPFIFKARFTKKRTKLLLTGKSAKAKVLTLDSTGIKINNQPQMRMTLEVMPPDGEPYRVDHKTLMSPYSLASVQPGATIGVKVDPENPQKLAIDLASSSISGFQMSTNNIQEIVSNISLPNIVINTDEQQQPEIACDYCGSSFVKGPHKCPNCGAPC